jgi:amino acid permease
MKRSNWMVSKEKSLRIRGKTWGHYIPPEDANFLPYYTAKFYILLTCIALWFLVNDQRDAQFFNTYLFLFLTLYMFRAHRARNM